MIVLYVLLRGSQHFQYISASLECKLAFIQGILPRVLRTSQHMIVQLFASNKAKAAKILFHDCNLLEIAW